jgi:uncharacterized lipoprotein YbaY/uncharacterized lipoprotein NlpE involved in copper resistance
MKMSIHVVSHLLLASLVTGVPSIFSPLLRADEMNVRATATYRERMALPPEAVLEATLEDISSADVQAELLGSVRIENPGSPPFHFEFAYDPARIHANHSYAVRARITVQGLLWFTTDQVYPVLTRGHGQEVELLLRRTGGAALASPVPLTLPATFAGELHCADCPGQNLVLTLFADHSYRLRRTYLGVNKRSDEVFYELGRRQYSPNDNSRVILHGDSEGGNQYRLASPDRLRLLDKQGNDIESALNYELDRQPSIDPLPRPMLLRGLYAYTADAASFNECHTGKRYPVSLEAAHIDMKQAYLALAKDNPGAPLLASIESRFEERTTDPGSVPHEQLIVERFEHFWPDETCAREALAKASLLNTYWRAVEIDGEPVMLAPEQREPHFLLASEGNRVQGSTGCNRIMWELRAERRWHSFQGPRYHPDGVPARHRATRIPVSERAQRHHFATHHRRVTRVT